MFTKTPLKRINLLLRDVSMFRNMYYGKIYLESLTVRCSYITYYTHYIRNSIGALAYNTPLDKYEVETFDTMYDWLNGANAIESITLWLNAIKEMDRVLETMSREEIQRHRILIELPDEYMGIIERLERIIQEVKYLK